MNIDSPEFTVTVTLQQLPVADKGERLVYHVEVGDLPKEETISILQRVAEQVTHGNGESIVAPMRNGVKSLEVSLQAV